MLEDGKISESQLMWLLVTTVFSTSVMFVSSITTKYAAQDAWLALLVPATLFGLLVGYISYTLGLRFPDKTVIQYSEDILGRYLGKIISLFYIFFFIYINALIIREFASFLATSFLPATPLEVFAGVVVVLAASAVRNGIEVIARINQLLVVVVLIAFVATIVLVAKDFDFSNLLPVFGQGIMKIMVSSLASSSFRGEVMVMLMFIPYLNKPEKSKRAVVTAVLVLGGLLTVDVIANLAVFGAEISHTRVFSTLSLVRYISLARFVERIEAVIMVLWVMGVFVKVAVFYYAAVLAIGQFAGLRDYKPMVWPVGLILMAVVDLIFLGSRQVAGFLEGPWPFFSYIFELVIPLLLLLVALIRKKGGAAS